MEKNYTYEITEDGYYILIDGNRVIHQYEPYISDHTKSYEENAKAQIEELKQAEENAKKRINDVEQLQQDVTDIQLALTEIYEMEVK